MNNHILKTFLASIALAGLASIAHATPPRVVSIEQEIIGVNANDTYLEFRISDNAGSHYTLRLDEYLSAVNIDTSMLRQDNPVRSTISNTVNSFPGELTERPVTGRVDPVQILIDNQASPYIYRGVPEVRGYALRDGALITNFGDSSGDSGTQILKTSQELLAIIESQINTITKRYPAISEAQEADLSGEYLKAPVITTLDGCEVAAQFSAVRSPDFSTESSDEEWILPLRIDCGEAEIDEVMYSFFVFVPDWYYLPKDNSDFEK